MKDVFQTRKIAETRPFWLFIEQKTLILLDSVYSLDGTLHLGYMSSELRTVISRVEFYQMQHFYWLLKQHTEHHLSADCETFFGIRIKSILSRNSVDNPLRRF